MKRLRKPPNSPLWYCIPLAIGLHGLILMLPIDTPKPAEKRQSASIKTVPLLKPPSPLAGLPKPSPTKPPVTAVSPPKPSARKASAAAQRSPSPAPSTLKPTPTTAAKPAPTPSPDVFQIQGAIACAGIKDCYTSAETNGREVSQTLERRLQAQGYVLEPLELNDDTGMKGYHLVQNGQPKDYLYIIWTDQGTRSLRLPQPVMDRRELAAKAGLPT